MPVPARDRLPPTFLFLRHVRYSWSTIKNYTRCAYKKPTILISNNSNSNTNLIKCQSHFEEGVVNLKWLCVSYQKPAIIVILIWGSRLSAPQSALISGNYVYQCYFLAFYGAFRVACGTDWRRFFEFLHNICETNTILLSSIIYRI